MKLLLDTHALLWWLGDDRALGTAARELIADPGNDVLVSTVSLWEVVLKVRLRKLEADVQEISAAMEREGFTLLAVSVAHLVALGSLPSLPDHRDPFDHLLIAQTIAEDATFLSEDRNTPRYPVRFVSCSATAAPPAPR